MVAVESAWLVLVALAVVALTWVWKAAVLLVWRPYAVAKAFARQGIRGPAYRFLVGTNDEVRAMRAATADDVLDRLSHDFIPRVLPQYRAWMAAHGKVFLSWTSHTPSLCVADYDMVKQIMSSRSGVYGKRDPGPDLMALLGKGLVFTDGDDWVRHRRILHPAFAMDKLKMMTKTMADCAGEVIRSWEALAAAASGERRAVQVDVAQQFVDLSTDVISHTAFGSSYVEGKEVFLGQRELLRMSLFAVNSVRVPGLDYVPTKTNVRRWRLEKKVRSTLMAIIDERHRAAREEASGGGYSNDLLGLMLEANASAGAGGETTMSMDEIIDECKTFFFAGHDTTSHLLTWSVFLLGTHPDWQQKLREEVLRECGGGTAPPHGDALNRLKLMTMVLYETLRLYGGVITITRLSTASTEIGALKVPKGTLLTMPIAIMHRDEEVWGADAGEFNPLRFRDSVGRAARHASALLSFSVGPRSCIGQDLAMLEAKAALAMVLRRFELEVAPEYVHAPADFLMLRPKHGLPAVLKLLDQ